MVRSRFGATTTTSRKRFSSASTPKQTTTSQLTSEQIAQQRQSQQLKTSLTTEKQEQLEFIRISEESLRRDFEPGQSLGVVERLNIDVAQAKAKVRAIDQIIITINKGSNVTASAAEKFISSKAQRVQQLQDISRREDLAQAKAIAKRKEVKVMTTREEVVPQREITPEQGRAITKAKARETRLLASPLSETPEFGVIGTRQTFDESVEVSGLQATKTFLSRGGEAVAGIISAPFTGGIEPSKFKDPTELFKDVGGLVGEQPFQGQIRDTRMTITTPETTPLEFRTISQGEITLKEAEELGIDTGFNIDERTGAGVVRTVKTAGTVGAIAGIAATSPFAAGAVGLGFVARGFGTGVEAATAGKLAERFEREGEFKEASFYKKQQTQKNIFAGLQIGGGLLGIKGSIGASQSAVDIQAMKDLQAQKFRIIGVEKVRTSQGSLFEVKAIREAGAAKQMVDFKFPAFTTGEKSFSITGGTGKSTTSLFSFRQEKFLIGEQSFTLGAKGTSALFGGSTNIQQAIGSGTIVETQPGTFRFDVKTGKGGVGKGFIQAKVTKVKDIKFTSTTEIKSGDFTEFKFGGLVEKKDGFFKVISGRAEKIKVPEFGGDSTVLIRPQAFGVIKEFSMKDIGGKILTTGKTSSFTGTTPQITTQVTQQEAALTAVSSPASIIGGREVTKLITPIIQEQSVSTILSTIPATTLVTQTAQSTRQSTIQAPALKIKQEQITTPTTTQVVSTVGSQKNLLGTTSTIALKSIQLQKQSQTQTTTTIPVIPSIIPRITLPPTKPPIIHPFTFGLGKPKTITPKGKFLVEVRRGGKFKTIARGQSFGRALGIGSKRVGRTLAATFRIKGFGKQEGFKLPSTIKRKKGKRLTFLEVPGARLDTPGEIKEIKLAKLSKGRIKL